MKYSFVEKLEKLIEKCEHTGYIRWNRDGDQIQFDNTQEFRDELKSLFNVQDMFSFINLLKMHGFRRINCEWEQNIEYRIPGYSFAHPCFLRQNLELRECMKTNNLKSSSNYTVPDICRYEAEESYLGSDIDHHSRVTHILENNIQKDIYMPYEYLEYFNDNQTDSFTEYSDISDSYEDYTDNTPYLADMASEDINHFETENYSNNIFQSNQNDISTDNQLSAALNNTQVINETEQYMLYSHDAPRLYNNGFDDDNYISSLIYADDFFYFDDIGFEDDDFISPELRPMTPSSQY